MSQDGQTYPTRPSGEPYDVLVARIDERTWAIFEALGRIERTQSAQRAEDRAELARQRTEDRAEYDRNRAADAEALVDVAKHLAVVDGRVGALEKWRWKFAGASLLAAGAVAYAFQAIPLIHR